MMWKIAKTGDYETIDFAALELKRYLSKIDPSNDYMILDCKKYDAERKDVLWVGYTPEFPVPEVEDAKFDDGISISVKKNAGYITGTNGRSVLIAVYRFLRELGCGFIRPGEKGEVIPARELKGVDIKIFEKASYRHRVMCLDGTTSYDNIVDMIDWLPKVGMNAFLNQDHLLYGNFKRWYHDKLNPSFIGEDFTREDAFDIGRQTIIEIKRRGMLYHSGGHRWTSEAFGLVPGRLQGSFEELPLGFRENIALIDGKRAIFGDSTINTNLCYNSEYAVDMLVKEAVRFCKQYPETDVLHFWFADGYNNHCECEKCQKTRPADMYVDVLNRVDEALAEENIDVKISLVVYDDLLWTPIKSKIKNEDRFILHYAPITRAYTDTLSNAEEFKGELPPFERNKLDFPIDNSWLIAHLKNWQKEFGGDSYDFDYHYMWEHHIDLGYYEIARILFKDMAELDKIGINGMITCQSMRCFLPSSLGMIAMAEALWNKNADFDKISDTYFYSAFGADGDKAQSYLKEISEIADISYLRGEKKVINPASAKRYEDLIAFVEAFAPVVSAHLEDKTLSEAQSLSWKYLTYHAELCKLFASALLLFANGKVDMAKARLEEVKEYPTSVLSEIHDVFDDVLFKFSVDFKLTDLKNRASQEVAELNNTVATNEEINYTEFNEFD